MSNAKKPTENQVDKFKDLARKLGTHDSEAWFKKAVEEALAERKKDLAERREKKPPAK
jgi:hypothetical protein